MEYLTIWVFLSVRFWIVGSPNILVHYRRVSTRYGIWQINVAGTKAFPIHFICRCFRGLETLCWAPRMTFYSSFAPALSGCAIPKVSAAGDAFWTVNGSRKVQDCLHEVIVCAGLDKREYHSNTGWFEWALVKFINIFHPQLQLQWGTQEVVKKFKVVFVALKTKHFFKLNIWIFKPPKKLISTYRFV